LQAKLILVAEDESETAGASLGEESGISGSSLPEDCESEYGK